MNMIKPLVIASSLLLCAMHTNGFAFSIGPFHFGGNQGQVVVERVDTFSQSLCYAISQQKKVEVMVELVDQSNANETKITTKRLVIEPYVFGLSQDNQLVVRAKVVDEKIVKEVSVKYPDQESAAKDTATPEQGDVAKEPTMPSKGDIGLFSVRQLNNLRVMEDSHFDAPKDHDQIFKDNLLRVFCHVARPVS